jgi:hypothetical protein
MYITITMEAEGRRYRLSIDDRQKTSAFHKLLNERGVLSGNAPPKMYKSELKGEWIRSDLTFKEQGVISGDLLTS